MSPEEQKKRKKRPRSQSVEAVFARIESRLSPTAKDVDLLVRHALALGRCGLDSRARALLQRWRMMGCKDPDLKLAESILTVAGGSGGASQRLRYASRDDPDTASMEVINCTYRGELKRASDIARAHGWFLDRVEATEALTNAVWALAMQELFDEAYLVVDAWKRVNSEVAPEKYQMMLRIESRIAFYQQQYPRELSLLQDADALCDRYGLETGKVFSEPTLAAAYARNGDFEKAEAVVAKWPSSESEEPSPLDSFRDRSRMEIAMLQGRYAAAYRLGESALRFYQAIQNAPALCQIQFDRVLCSSRDQYPKELDAYRRMVYRYQMGQHSRRLELLERFAALGTPEPSGIDLRVRTRHGQTRVPVVFLWSPRIEWVGAGLYWDRVRSILHLEGNGPFSLAAHPVLHRLMEFVLGQPGYSATVAALFSAVWGGRYDPLMHEGKVHVTVHRLRKWMEQRCTDSACMILVRDGKVMFDERLDVKVIELPSGKTQPRPGKTTGLQERLVQCLGWDESLAPRDLERRLGVSRSALNQALRRLVAAGRVQRLGKGRSVRYRMQRK